MTSSCLDEDGEEDSPLADTHPPSSYGHDNNRTKTDNPAAEQTCSNDMPPKSAKFKRQLVKRPAKHRKETASKKKKTAAVGRLPTINDCKFSASEIYEYFANHCRNRTIPCYSRVYFFRLPAKRPLCKPRMPTVILRATKYQYTSPGLTLYQSI